MKRQRIPKNTLTAFQDSGSIEVWREVKHFHDSIKEAKRDAWRELRKRIADFYQITGSEGRLFRTSLTEIAKEQGEWIGYCFSVEEEKIDE